MSKRKIPAFKMIPAKMREHLGELTGNELKVWLYLHLHTGEEGTAFPSNQTMADALKINRETVKDAKKALRAKGWFVRIEQRKRQNGSFSTVVEKTIMPWQGITATDDGKNSHGTVAAFTVDGKSSQPEVDTINPEVPLTLIQGEPLKDSALTSGVSKQVSEQGVSPSAQRDDERLKSQNSKIKESGDKPATTPKAKPIPMTEGECRLMDFIQPMWDPFSEKHAYVVAIREILSICESVEIAPYDILRFNRAHKRGSLYIRTPEQFRAALVGKDGEYAMLNDYATHDHKHCKLCYAAGVVGVKPAPKAAAAGKGFDLEDAE